MKEYLEKQADDSYKLVMRGIAGKDDDIEVPEGAEVAVYPYFSKGISFFKNNFRFAYADSSGEWKETDYCPENLKYWKSWRVAWKRHVQPEELPFMDSLPEFKCDFGASSLNDQYAEIEQLKQKHKCLHGDFEIAKRDKNFMKKKLQDKNAVINWLVASNVFFILFLAAKCAGWV